MVTVVRVVCVMTAVVMTDAGRGAQVIYLPDSACRRGRWAARAAPGRRSTWKSFERCWMIRRLRR